MDYLVNKDFIAETLCIEKDVEESTCDGKCYLKKKLDKVEQTTDNDDNPIPQRVQLQEIFFLDTERETLGIQNVCGYLCETGLYLSPALSDGHCQIESPPPEYC